MGKQASHLDDLVYYKFSFAMLSSNTLVQSLLVLRFPFNKQRLSQKQYKKQFTMFLESEFGPFIFGLMVLFSSILLEEKDYSWPVSPVITLQFIQKNLGIWKAAGILTAIMFYDLVVWRKSSGTGFVSQVVPGLLGRVFVILSTQLGVQL